LGANVKVERKKKKTGSKRNNLIGLFNQGQDLMDDWVFH
jgi:hypothetical protein